MLKIYRLYNKVRDYLILYILHHMACIAGAEPEATKFSSPDHEYMGMVIIIAWQLTVYNISWKLTNKSLWVPVYGF